MMSTPRLWIKSGEDGSSAVQICPDLPICGAIAQLGERLPCTQEVSGSIPLGSTTPLLPCQSLEMNIRLEY